MQHGMINKGVIYVTIAVKYTFSPKQNSNLRFVGILFIQIWMELFIFTP